MRLSDVVVNVDGPYGVSIPVHRYTHIVMIAGYTITEFRLFCMTNNRCREYVYVCRSRPLSVVFLATCRLSLFCILLATPFCFRPCVTVFLIFFLYAPFIVFSLLLSSRHIPSHPIPSFSYLIFPYFILLSSPLLSSPHLPLLSYPPLPHSLILSTSPLLSPPLPSSLITLQAASG